MSGWDWDESAPLARPSRWTEPGRLYLTREVGCDVDAAAETTVADAWLHDSTVTVPMEARVILTGVRAERVTVRCLGPCKVLVDSSWLTDVRFELPWAGCDVRVERCQVERVTADVAPAHLLDDLAEPSAVELRGCVDVERRTFIMGGRLGTGG